MDGILDRNTADVLKYLHGAFNLLMAAGAWTMLRLGLAVRKLRAEGRPTLRQSSLHMRTGPFLAVLGPTGFLAGLVLVILDKGRPLEYPPHFALGLFIAAALPSMFVLSRFILRGSSMARAAHRRLGIALASAYLLQVMAGLGILFQ